MLESRKNLVIDLVALLAYAIAANPALTGIGFHEWISLGTVLVLFIHVVFHVDRIVDAFKAIASHHTVAQAGNLVLDVFIFVVLVVCMVSGLMVSGAVLPTFGFYATGYYFWNPLHAVSAKLLLSLLLIHVIAHWRWTVNILKKKGNDRAK